MHGLHRVIPEDDNLMLGNIKDALRAPVINKLHKRYLKELNNQYVQWHINITYIMI